MNPEDTTPERGRDQVDDDTEVSLPGMPGAETPEGGEEATMTVSDGDPVADHDDSDGDTEPVMQPAPPQESEVDKDFDVDSAPATPPQAGTGDEVNEETGWLDDDRSEATVIVDGEKTDTEPIHPATPGAAFDREIELARGAPAGGDDVFVILPEQVEENIPVVRTEAVDAEVAEDVALLREMPGEGRTPEATEELDQTDPVTVIVTDEGGFGDLNFDDTGSEATELVGDDDLEQLASELDDDDVLMGDDSDEGLSVEDLERGLDEVDSRPSRRLSHWFLPLAAAVLVGVTGYYFINPQFAAAVSSYLGWPPPESVRAPHGGPPGQQPGVPQGGADTGRVDVVDAGVGSTTTDFDEVREAIRSRVQLALRMGFMGEEADYE